MYLKVAEVLTFDEFKDRIADTGRFLGNKVVVESGGYYIQSEGVDFEMLESDLLVVFHDGLFFTISSEGSEVIKNPILGQ